METSFPDLNFLDTTTLTPDTNPVDVKVAEEKCPVCWQNNKISKVRPVYYKMREAIYTCEDTNCLYFVTDDSGNLQKFTKTNGSLNYSGNVVPSSQSSHSNELTNPNGSSNPLSAPTRSNEIVDSSSYLDDFFNSEPNNDDDVKSIMNELSNFFENNQSEK